MIPSKAAKRFARRLLATLMMAAATMLSGCAFNHDEQVAAQREDYLARYDSVLKDQEPRTAGAIYTPSASTFLRSDRRARGVGDILTVRLVEDMPGSSTAKNSDKRNGSHKMSVSTPIVSAAGGLLNSVASLVLPDRNADSLSGRAEDILKDNSIGTTHSFAGEGKLEKSNTMDGFVTVTVERLFPNGNLFVVGEKQVETDGGTEHVRLRGIIRPDDIGSDNTVASTRIAQADIAYVSAGDRYYASREGWLGRFFNKVDPL